MNTSIYEKPEGARYSLRQILGNGLLVVEGDKHRQQVRYAHTVSSDFPLTNADRGESW